MRCTIHWQFSCSSIITVRSMARLSYVLIAMNALICVLAEDLYSDLFAKIDIPAVLQNNDLREEYYKCYMEIATCKTPEQKAMTEMFTEAMRTKCQKCTEKQKETMKLISDWYTKNEPDKWQLILAKSTKK